MMKRLTSIIDSGLRTLDAERLIRASGLFDPDWYARNYSVAGGSQNSLSHFLRTGAAQGHDPGPRFSTAAYLAANPDVREAGYNALVHFLRHGRDEGRGDAGLAELPDPSSDGAAAARVRQAFDAAFYIATNPDLPDDIDALNHFLSRGWMDRRDPCPWFSVEAYLLDHPDVAEAGRNPFVHYLLWGCREGRKIRSSRRETVERGVPATGRRRLAALSMVRNEGDIIRAFSAHLLALFDDIVFVDHQSEDGTAGYLEQLAAVNRRVTVLKLEEPGYIQSVTMTHMVRSQPVFRDADWVFVLDADEFLPFANRPGFEAALARYSNCPVIGMHWKNLVPESYWDGEVSLDFDTRFVVPPDNSPLRKVAFQPGKLSLDRTVIAQGNHALIETLNGLDVPVFDADFPLLHLPIRSADQLVLKLNQGGDAYRRLGQMRDESQGTHWDQMARTSSGSALDANLLNALVVAYSEDKSDTAPVSVEELQARGHKVETFELAAVDPDVPNFKRLPTAELLLRMRHETSSVGPVPDCPATTTLEMTNGVLRRAKADAGREYPSLPASDPTDEPIETSEILARLLPHAFADIDDLVPSAKGGHIPFLIALTAMARPRRVVELGTLGGAGFLGICQSIHRNALNAEAVAISGWSLGCDHPDEYRNIFETFQFLLRKYSSFAGFLRQNYDAAAERFADGSVDLLILDGFCEDVPLRQALEIWLPKLSSRGLLLLHDTNVHRTPFGVWRVWDEIASAHAVLEFPHSEGLGLACIGPDAPPEIVGLCRLAGQDRNMRSFLFQFFERLGDQSAELFSRRYDMAQSETRAQAEGAQAEELSWLKQEVESLRADNGQLRDLLQGTLAHAVPG